MIADGTDATYPGDPEDDVSFSVIRTPAREVNRISSYDSQGRLRQERIILEGDAARSASESKKSRVPPRVLRAIAEQLVDRLFFPSHGKRGEDGQANEPT